MAADAAPGGGRGGVLAVALLALLGLIAVGRLAMEAWLHRPAPAQLPEIGATRTEATPFLLVVIDGLREESAFAAADPPMPWFQALARRGVGGVALAGDPTLTAPCVRTLLTGRLPDLLTAFRNFSAREVKGSLVEYLARRGGRTAHGGDAAVYQLCRSHYRPEDVLQFPDQGPVDQGHCDRQAVPFVAERIRAGATVVSLHLTGPDHAGHKYGATGREYWEACRRVDEQIAPIVEDFLARHPDAYVLVASDHGVSAMGTHGGGESEARRAPFALVGPQVARGAGLEVSQAALAPTLAVLMGLPLPPLAEAPPDARLMALPEARVAEALDAYLAARLAVARDLEIPGVDLIERRRAALALGVEVPARRAEVATLIAGLNRLLTPSSAGYATLALLLAAGWLVLLVGVAGRYAIPPRRAAAVGAALLLLCALAVNLLGDLVALPPLGAGAALLLGTALVAGAAPRPRAPGGFVTLACLASLPVLTAAGVALQSAWTRGPQGEGLGSRLLVVGAATALLLGATLKPRRLLAWLAARARTAPGLVPAFGGVAVGFTLTLRPFIDPHVHLMLLYALLALGLTALLAWRGWRAGRPAPEALALLAVGLVLFLGTRLLEYYGPGADGGPWVVAAGPRAAWLAGLGLGLVALGGGLARWKEVARADVPALALAGLALCGAFLPGLPGVGAWLATVRWAESPLDVWQALGVNGLALAALFVALARGTPEGRLLARVGAATALARRLALTDGEFAAFALAAVGCMLAARLRLAHGRRALAWLAVGVLALRTGVFHAMGFVESFSTLDVGAAFKGLGEAQAQALDAAGGAHVTWQVKVAGLQLALRMALPWVLLLAAVMRAAARSGAAGAPPRLVGDVALSFAARGAAIAAALWAWWMSVWWTTLAYTVYAFAAADVVLLLVCAGACGVFGERRAAPRPAPREARLLRGAPAGQNAAPWTA